MTRAHGTEQLLVRSTGPGPDHKKKNNFMGCIPINLCTCNVQTHTSVCQNDIGLQGQASSTKAAYLKVDPLLLMMESGPTS